MSKNNGKFKRGAVLKTGATVIKKDEVKEEKEMKEEIKNDEQKEEVVVTDIIPAGETTEEIPEAEFEEISEEESTESKGETFLQKNIFTILVVILIAFSVSSLVFGGWYGKNILLEMQSKKPIHDTINQVIIVGDTDSFKRDTVIQSKSGNNVKIDVTKTKIYTYIIHDDFTNDAIVIRSTFDNPDKIVEYLRSLYPEGTKLDVISKSETEYSRELTKNLPSDEDLITK